MAGGLTHLVLDDIGLLPLQQQQQQQQQQDGETGWAKLLQLLARLPALQLMRLADLEAEWPQQLSAFSSLTASSNLQKLEVYGCDIPEAAWQYAFPAGRKLPNLHTFDTRNATGRGAVFCSAAIAGLAACCPALRALTVAADEYARLTPLASLTALSSLMLCPISPTEVFYLPRLTQLKELYVYIAVSPDTSQEAAFGLPDLVCLTALTGLKELAAHRFEREDQGSYSGDEGQDDIRETSECLVYVYTEVSVSWELALPGARDTLSCQLE
jgi:hypothetical protein